MPFRNENVEVGLPRGNVYQVGISDVDNGQIIESGVSVPLATTNEATWVYFECSVGVLLDSGIVVHYKLPQVDGVYDTLSSDGYGSDAFNQLDNGVNLKCKDQYTDIAQRMGHARYLFRLWGRALRIGKQIPIPGIKFIGGVSAVPYDNNPQWAYNSIVPGGSFAGSILWKAEWSLWYTTLVPPTSNAIPAADPSAHVTSDFKPLDSVQAPFSQPDDNSVTSIPAALFAATRDAQLRGKGQR